MLPWLSRVFHTAFGATALLNIGHAAYKTESFVDVALDDDAFTTVAIDIAAAGNNIVLDATLDQFDIHSVKGVDVIGVVSVLDVAAADEIHGYIAYLHE